MKSAIKSFTLIEVMVVLVIIGISASIAVSHYLGMREEALQREAVANVRLMIAAERVVRMEQNTFVACANAAACNIALGLRLNANFAYSVDCGGGACTAASVSCNAVATRVNPSTGVVCTYTFNSANPNPLITSGAGTCSYTP